MFATDVQEQEIKEIPYDIRKQGIKQTAEKIRVKFMETSAMIVALDQKCEKGFRGSRVDGTRIASDEDGQLLKTLSKFSAKCLFKNQADLLIFYTAIKENMDFLVTRNIDDFKKPLELFKVERGTKLQIKDNKDFEELL